MRENIGIDPPGAVLPLDGRPRGRDRRAPCGFFSRGSDNQRR